MAASMEPVNILEDVIAYVEVRSNSDNRSAAICHQLESLGAKVESSFTDNVTHVVYKEGLKRTYLKAQRKGIPLVSVSWLESCKRNQRKMPETDFIALVEKEPDNLLMKMKQNRRWKKMKSMQPCDFDEEVARSAERNKKQRRRIELANRFKLAEDTTPPGGSPAMVLAMDTQARSSSPFFGNTSRFSSPLQSVVPDTPATPTMKERIEKMRREQRNVIGADVQSPKSSVLETAMLQRKLFEKLAKDIFKADSSDEDDGGETTARVVAKLIKGLGESSGTSASATKSVNDGDRPSGEEKGSDEKELESIFLSVTPTSAKSNLNRSADHGNEREKSPQKTTPGSGRLSLGCRKENESKTEVELVREMRQSAGSSSDEPFVLSPMCSNKVPSLVTNPCVSEQTTDLERSTTNIPTTSLTGSVSKLDAQSEGSGSNRKDKGLSEEPTPTSTKAVRKTQNQPTKPKTVQKRKLFTDPVFSMGVLPVEEIDTLSKQSPEAPSSNAKALAPNKKPETFKPKGKRKTEAAEVSFLFSGATNIAKTGEDKNTTDTSRRKSKRLSVNNLTSLSSVRGTELGDQNTSSLRGNKSSSTKDVDDVETSYTNVRTTRRSLGTSMSVLYGTDSTMLNSSTDQPSRRSIDEFSLRNLNSKSKKNVTQNQSNQQNTTVQRKKSVKKNDKSLEGNGAKKDNSVESIKKESEVGKSPPSKKRKTVKSVSDVKQDNDSGSGKNTSSGSDSSADRLTSPRSLRHANSMVMDLPDCNIAGRRKLSLVMTSLHRHEQDVVRSVIKKLGVFKLTDNVDSCTTHLVCGEPRRTLNLLRATAGGCWVLRKEWVLESLEAGVWLMEEKYEMAQEFPAVKECRSRRQALGKLYRADLFSHLGPIFVSVDCVPPRQELVFLIMLCSGKVANSKQRASLFIGMEHLPDKTIVKPTWILDSVMSMSLQDPGEYIIPAVTRHREKSPEF